MKPAFDKGNVAIAFAVDHNYLLYLKCAIKSLVANCKCCNLDIIVLHAEDLDDSEIVACFKGELDLSIRFLDVSEIVSREIAPYFVQNSYLTIACTYRLLLPDLLSSYDKVLWLDTDILVTGDIAELFNNELGECWVGAVVDVGLEKLPLPEFMSYCSENRPRWAKKFNFEPWRGYFNSGVMLMDLAALRKAKVRNRLIEIAVDPDSLFPDQDALNAVCKGRVKYLDKRWNFQVQKGSGWMMNGVGVVHFVGRSKPWFSMTEEYADLWWKYVDIEDLLPVFKKSLEWNAQQNKKDIDNLDAFYCEKLRKMKHSVSYKLGRALTKPFRAIFSKC